MSEEIDRKLKSWWHVGWLNSYIATLVFGIGVIVIGAILENLPGLLRMIFIVFGIILVIASFFSAKSRWKKV